MKPTTVTLCAGSIVFLNSQFRTHINLIASLIDYCLYVCEECIISIRVYRPVVTDYQNKHPHL